MPSVCGIRNLQSGSPPHGGPATLRLPRGVRVACSVCAAGHLFQSMPSCRGRPTWDFSYVSNPAAGSCDSRPAFPPLPGGTPMPTTHPGCVVQVESGPREPPPLRPPTASCAPGAGCVVRTPRLHPGRPSLSLRPCGVLAPTLPRPRLGLTRCCLLSRVGLTSSHPKRRGVGDRMYGGCVPWVPGSTGRCSGHSSSSWCRVPCWVATTLVATPIYS